MTTDNLLETVEKKHFAAVKVPCDRAGTQVWMVKHEYGSDSAVFFNRDEANDGYDIDSSQSLSTQSNRAYTVECFIEWWAVQTHHQITYTGEYEAFAAYNPRAKYEANLKLIQLQTVEDEDYLLLRDEIAGLYADLAVEYQVAQRLKNLAYALERQRTYETKRLKARLLSIQNLVAKSYGYPEEPEYLFEPNAIGDHDRLAEPTDFPTRDEILAALNLYDPEIGGGT